MNNELTMEQMDSTSGGVDPVTAGLAGLVALEKTGAISFYINWYKNVKNGQDVGTAAVNAGKTAGVAGMEED